MGITLSTIDCSIPLWNNLSNATPITRITDAQFSILNTVTNATYLVMDKPIRFRGTGGAFHYAKVSGVAVVGPDLVIDILGEPMTVADDDELYVNLFTRSNIYVSQDRGTTDSDGTLDKPFLTIVEAVNFAETYATTANPVTIQIDAGVYAENVVVRKTGVNLNGVNKTNTRIIPVAGVPLIITNATAVSLTTFLTAGGQADPATHYALLVADPLSIPNNNNISNITLGAGAIHRNDLMILGAGAGCTMGATYRIIFKDVDIACDSYLRNFNMMRLDNSRFNSEWGTNGSLWVNVSFVDFAYGNFGNTFNIIWNVGLDIPSFGMCFGINFFYITTSSITIGGAVNFGDFAGGGTQYTCQQLEILNELVINDTANVCLSGCTIHKTITIAGGARLRMRNCHVQGAQTYTNAAPNTACLMDGGRYMGAITDVGGRLIRRLGDRSTWKNVTTATAITRVSDIQFTIINNIDNALAFIIGRPIRYRGLGGTWRYGMIIGVAVVGPNLVVNIVGAPMTIADDDELCFDTTRSIIAWEITIPGAWGDGIDATLLANDLLLPGGLPWPASSAYLVRVTHITRVDDSGAQPTWNAVVGGQDLVAAAIATSQVEVSTVSVDVTSYNVVLGTAIELRCVAAGGVGDTVDGRWTYFFVME